MTRWTYSPSPPLPSTTTTRLHSTAAHAPGTQHPTPGTQPHLISSNLILIVTFFNISIYPDANDNDNDNDNDSKSYTVSPTYLYTFSHPSTSTNIAISASTHPTTPSPQNPNPPPAQQKNEKTRFPSVHSQSRYQ
ncbi:hypothetical protein CC80DRAFT_282661 [Byssothecium circinans]|uniref:Uncharacterized protein n=1 Tax=Byssothecium circinans TaxID=147558 RepID=A0A6A5TB74_9PLEO|nr:hypothetical protein CC80DRAFT_282661 [Byssothecium circinans]